MKNPLRIALAALVAGVFGVALSASAATAPARQHGTQIKGSIVTLNDTAKTMTVKDLAGKEVELSWTTATRIQGKLAVGSEATVRYMDKDGREIASSIRVSQPDAHKKG